MKGDATLWVPGTDHAGISTQNVVVKNLEQQGIKREELGREKFVEEVWKWKEQSHKVITNQIKKMGSSVSWDHERFTLDENNNQLVNQSFVDLYKK